MEKAVIYIRVSSADQNVARQVEALKKLVNESDFDQVETFTDKLSGSVPFADREIGGYLDQHGDQVKLLIVHDLDRLGRNAIDIQQTIERLSDQGINVRIAQQGISTLLENGKRNPAAQIVVSVLATLAQMEREKIRERQREGIEIAKREGKFKGRKPGTKESAAKFLAKHKAVVKELKQGTSVRRAAKLCDVSPATVQKVKKAMG